MAFNAAKVFLTSQGQPGCMYYDSTNPTHPRRVRVGGTNAWRYQNVGLLRFYKIPDTANFNFGNKILNRKYNTGFTSIDLDIYSSDEESRAGFHNFFRYFCRALNFRDAMWMWYWGNYSPNRWGTPVTGFIPFSGVDPITGKAINTWSSIWQRIRDYIEELSYLPGFPRLGNGGVLNRASTGQYAYTFFTIQQLDNYNSGYWTNQIIANIIHETWHSKFTVFPWLQNDEWVNGDQKLASIVIPGI